MPLRSMTGFGAGEGEVDGLAIRAEARSVNHRYLQVKTRVPAELAFLEPEIEALVKKKVQRGAVSVHVQADRAEAGLAAEIDVERARRYQSEIEELRRALDLAGEVTVDLVLGMPGVLVEEGDEGRLRAHKKPVLAAVAGAVQRMVEMRQAEGQRLVAELEKHAKAIARTLASIERRMPAVVRSAHASLARRVNELLGGTAPVQPGDMARELALLADRADVSEETARVASHLTELRSQLERGGASGRRLDFLVQEMFREVNTIGAKCSDAKVAHQVVDLKTRIERLREQVQNLE